jgi:signal transduction histidine kinase
MIATGEVSGAEVTASARAIVDQANRITAMIKDILASVRRPATKERPQTEISSLLHRTVKVVERRARKARVDVLIDRETEDLVLNADPGGLLQVLSTLTFNAIDATREGGRVVLGARKEPGRYAIYVRDHGSGIEKENIPRIFKPFFRTANNGTGLGLAIAQGIVRDHGGWIDVDSQIGLGTTFKVCLPEGG